MTGLGQKILAVGSGKGGVGKSTTALNIALLFAKSGKRTGIIDMDPLSNLGVILDLSDQEVKPGDSLAGYTRRIFPRLDLLFSHEKTGKDRSSMYELVFGRFAAELYRHYDIIIMDMPAGIVQDENLRIFPHLKHLLVVTNAEPTSHVSAGGYIKAALEVNSQMRFFIWNNKYEAGVDPGFNPRDLLGNYNRYAPDELRLPDSVKDRLEHVAYVPPDPALNLLKTASDFRLDLLFKIRESLQLLYELIIPLHDDESLPLINRRILRYYLLREYRNPDPEKALEYNAEFFSASVDTVFKNGTRGIATRYIHQQMENPLRKSVSQSIQIVDRILQIYQNSSRNRVHEIRSNFVLLSNRLMRNFAMFNRLIERSGEESIQKRFGNLDIRMLKNAAGLSFFYFAILKLLEHERIRQLLRTFIPQKKKNGRSVRDRHRQIMLLVKKDHEYHRRYFKLIKALFPIMERQLYRLAKTQKLRTILLYDSEGRIKRNVYLRLLSELLHDLLNAGLGVHVGIHFNKAAREIHKGWEQIHRNTVSRVTSVYG